MSLLGRKTLVQAIDDEKEESNDKDTADNEDDDDPSRGGGIPIGDDTSTVGDNVASSGASDGDCVGVLLHDVSDGVLRSWSTDLFDGPVTASGHGSGGSSDEEAETGGTVE